MGYVEVWNGWRGGAWWGTLPYAGVPSFAVCAGADDPT